MKAGQILIVIVLSTGVFSVTAWDIAVAVGGQVHFLNTTGEEAGSVSEGMTEVRALAYNSELRRMYFSDDERPGGSIFELNVPETLSNNTGTSNVRTVVSKQMHQVKGIAYDDMTGILYWSNGRGHAILWVRVGITDEPQAGQPLQGVTEPMIPMGIAIDTCKRYLYWSNCGPGPSIERSLLDGSKRRTLISTGLSLPNAVVVDQTTDRLYWVDERHGAEFRIESSDLNGDNRKVFASGADHQPFALAVSGGSVFWADHMHLSVWRLPLNHSHSSTQQEPIRVSSYSTSPHALVPAYSGRWISEHCNPVIEPIMKVIPATVIKTTSEMSITPRVNASQPAVCLNNGFWMTEGYCHCLPGYSGTLCEVDECRGYCMNGGACEVRELGPVCQCAEGFIGMRCEQSVCYNYCVNGNCNIDLAGQPQCHCKEGYAGERCEVNFTQQQELRDNLQEVCKAFCKIWAAQSPTNTIQPFQSCSCPDYAPLAPLESEWSTGNYGIVVLLALCSMLMLVIAVLTKKVLVLRKRPRIKKRIIVNKGLTPLTCRPNATGGEQCEITIENCCNMNICETPCFEPDFRQPQATLTKNNNKGAKEEKKTLLGNMELPPDDLY